MALLDTPSLVRLVLADLARLLGVHGTPVFVHHTMHRKAIPQYEVGFGRHREFMSALEQDAPGLFLAGHYRDGISLSDSIVSGDHAAERLGQFVAGRKLTSQVHLDLHPHSELQGESEPKAHACQCNCGGKRGEGACARERLMAQRGSAPLSH